jgi:hypothetical protein
MATLAEAQETAADFLRFYLQGGAAAVRAGTRLIDAPPGVLESALQKFDANPTPSPVTTIEADPFDVFVRTPGIAGRIPAVVGPAPDFIEFSSPDLDRAIFTRPIDAESAPETLGLQGPVPIEDEGRPIKSSDVYVDMCAMEDAVVVATPAGGIEVTFLWVQDYPATESESADVPDPGALSEDELPRVRPLVDGAQPSVIAAECMEALESFLGPDVFREFTFRWRLELCAFEALDATRQSVLQSQ